MTVRELMALGFTPKSDGSLHSPARVVLTPSGDAYYGPRAKATRRCGFLS